eukprot:CAMPEP_0168425388 /NCGR_PEP_ID=MMETSP0228-20121227/35299_1 /TAXON_ID=133427 /ORGANISM="Protoceratium reticulatum, Strain CCCM 535 (=CCMP 1889)" /LENGTH=263 /DNA_ID=CAMNT_0008439381 /DNA_START=61 /DNA_END=852 /DNA_ORIENTATION=+
MASVRPSSASGELPQARRGLAGLLGCGRRPPPEEAERVRLQEYRDIIVQGRKVADKRKDWYEKLAWWSDCKTKRGARIFVVVPRGPRGEHDTWIYMWELLSFAASRMHEHVVTEDKPFAIVWVQFGDHRMWSAQTTRFRNSLHPKYAKNFEALHVVHPSWTVRVLRLLLWPVAPDEFWDRFHCHERVEFLEPFIDMRKFRLPKDVYEHDKWLDKQALEMNEQAKNRGLGGMGGSMMSEDEKKKQQDQMEAVRKMMGQSGTKRD